MLTKVTDKLNLRLLSSKPNFESDLTVMEKSDQASSNSLLPKFALENDSHPRSCR